MKLEPLKQFFQRRLTMEMPGESAHRLMQPILKNGSNVRFKHTDTPREGGVLILFYESQGIVRFPLIERPEYDGVHSGQIALPGGKQEDTDNDLIETALREAEEEIGVEMRTVEVLGSLSKFYVGASNYNILPVIGVAKESPRFIPDPREVNDIITPSALDLLDDRKRGSRDITVQNGFTLTSPFFDLENKMVWGATAMMLSELVAILSEFNTSADQITEQ